MQYNWKLDEVARLVAHMHYLEDTMDEVIEQKNIAVNWIRDKLKAFGEIRVFDDQRIEYMDEEGYERVFRWNVTTREGEEIAQFMTPLKRYRWFQEEYRRTQDRLDEWRKKLGQEDE